MRFAMLRKLLVLAALLFTGPVLAQSVQQSGTVTNKHVPYWVTSGVIADGGSATDSPVSSIGVTNNGGAGFCVSSDRQTAAGRNQLCFGASTAAAATISLQNYGTAAAQNLQFVINGTPVTVPTGGGNFIVGTGTFGAGHVPCFVSTAGVVQDCGLSLSGGIITAGVWQGTPIAIANGGTGATSSAGAQANLGLGTMALQNANSVAVTGGTITGMPSPSVASDVAIKSYVDATASGLTILAASGLATAAVLPNTPTYANGASGVGATLTAGSNTTLTVDGTIAVLNSVVLVKNQASTFQNGIYTVTTAGSGAAAWVLTRATYFDTAAKMKVGSYSFITGGATNINSSWTSASTVVTVGTDPITFNQFSSTNGGVLSINGVTGVVATGSGLTTNGSTLQTTYTATGTGAVAQTIPAKLAGYLVAQDFGVKCDGSTDDTSNITAADVAAAAANKALHFPGGTCIVSSTLTPSTGAHWIGDSYAGTILKRNSAVCAILTVSNAFVTLDELQFASTTTCTSGAFIALSAGNFTAHDLYATGSFNCLTIGTAGTQVNVSVVLIDQLQCLNTVATTGVSIVVNNNTANGNVELRNIFANNSAGARPFAHINLINSPDFTCVDCNLLSAQHNFYINPGNGQSVLSFNFVAGFLDQASIGAADIVPAGTGFVGRSRFLGTWFFCANSSCNGLNITTAGTSNVDGIDCTSCDFYSNSVTSTNGIVTSQGAGTTIKNVTINNSRVAAWANGVNIGGLTSGSIRNSKIGSNANFGVNTTGVALGGVIGTLSITTNDLTGNTTAFANAATSTLLTILTNAGYNPVGPPTGISVTASPFTYTAGPSPETVYLNGGVVSLVETASSGSFVSVLVTTNTSAYLGPNEQLRVTYSAPPTMVKSIH